MAGWYLMSGEPAILVVPPPFKYRCCSAVRRSAETPLKGGDTNKKSDRLLKQHIQFRLAHERPVKPRLMMSYLRLHVESVGGIGVHIRSIEPLIVE